MGLITYTSKIRPIIEYSSSVWGDSSPVLGGLSGYLQDEIERVQSRSLGMLGLDRNYIPSLSSRRELATIREVKTIQADLNHPCHNLLPEPTDHSYDLRQTITEAGSLFYREQRDINYHLLHDPVNIYNNFE